MKFSRRSKKFESLRFYTLGKKIRNVYTVWKIEKLREKNVEKLEKKSSPIRMTFHMTHSHPSIHGVRVDPGCGLSFKF